MLCWHTCCLCRQHIWTHICSFLFRVISILVGSLAFRCCMPIPQALVAFQDTSLNFHPKRHPFFFALSLRYFFCHFFSRISPFKLAMHLKFSADGFFHAIHYILFHDTFLQTSDSNLAANPERCLTIQSRDLGFILWRILDLVTEILRFFTLFYHHQKILLSGAHNGNDLRLLFIRVN